ncbi:MAG TPA: 4-(cytidine 5'-diphospho)-2-C-methyl-D-erythritol kinase [Verrucomicrobiota bacterium]|nr:4-(cytidine 5'-diphospho)-2-C-methyl-D-erythritol kinase [Verrucomicrobiales bacterium]HRI15805.1 4-(cytidine 5'-diphospho)-2-C-methyl-D-erythritol kinase [Verrucomicrobiota bacterium]
MALVRRSPCKVNFVLNVLGRRPDGFHELETLFFPVPLFDQLHFEPALAGLTLTCSRPELPVDATNLVHQAATKWFAAVRRPPGVRIHLEKRLPLAAGLGAGSANAAITLSALNELFGAPLSLEELHTLAASLGSDVNFFLQPNPALAFGRGERIEPLPKFETLTGRALLLFHPGFGVPTPWAFRELADFPRQRDGKPGRARDAARALLAGELAAATPLWYNALEGPVLRKYPILALYQEFLRAAGAIGTLMCGSGSTTFALFDCEGTAREVVPRFRTEFGEAGWLEVATL